MEARDRIILFVVSLILVAILAYFYPHPIITLMFVILFACLLPSIIFNGILIYSAIPYITTKKGEYKMVKDGTNLYLDKFFDVHIYGKKDYGRPVIYTLNHPPSGFHLIDYMCAMKIQDKHKIVTIEKDGFQSKLFRNIEHINIKKNEKNRTDDLKNQIKEAIKDGYSIVIYPEGLNSSRKKLNKELLDFRSGSFIIAKELDIPIVPVIIPSGYYTEGIVHFNDIKIHYCDLIEPSKYSAEELKDHVYNVMQNKIRSL